MSGCSLPFINTFCGHSLKNHTDYSKEPSFPQCRRVLQNHARNFRPGRTLPNVRTKPLRESRTWNERLMRLHEDRQSASFLKKTRFAKPRARFPPGAHVTERAHKAAPRKPNLEREINAASRRPAILLFSLNSRFVQTTRAIPPGAHVAERAHKAAPRKPNLERKNHCGFIKTGKPLLS